MIGRKTKAITGHVTTDITDQHYVALQWILLAEKCFWILVMISTPPFKGINNVHDLGADILSWCGWYLFETRLQKKEDQLEILNTVL